MTHSKYWPTMVDILERRFPKGKSKERGQALVMLAYIEMLLTGSEFADGEPILKSDSRDMAAKEPQKADD